MKNRQRKSVFPLIIVTISFLLLAACGLNKQTTFAPEDFRVQIIENAMGLVEDIEGQNEELTLESIQYGNFSGYGKEAFAILKITPSPHVGGLDRTLCVVYKADDLSVVASREFLADFVQIRILPTASGKSHVLYLGTTTYQGVSSQDMQLFEIEDNEWKSNPVNIPQLNDEVNCILANQTSLLILQKNCNSASSQFFIWNIITESFDRAEQCKEVKAVNGH